jgi:hypothetical protein
MSITRRIFFSMPHHTGHETIPNIEPLTDVELDLIYNLAKKVTQIGYCIEAFSTVGNLGSLRDCVDCDTANSAWTFDNVDRVMRQCVGAVFIGVPRWIITSHTAHTGPWHMATEYSYYEAGVSKTLGLPGLVLAQKGLVERVVFDPALVDCHVTFPERMPKPQVAEWLESPEFLNVWNGWVRKLDERYDLFLGYSSKSIDLAKMVKQQLEHLGAKVLDWMDFRPSGSILERIEDAARRCSGGVFLFTKDDQLAGEGEQAVPRDNVVFEAGYFAGVKGKQRVLIIREQGSKLPADLEGDIYAALGDKSDIAPIDHKIQEFVEKL